VNGGSQHPSKRRGGGHGPTLADEVEHEITLMPTPQAHNAAGPKSAESIAESRKRWHRGVRNLNEPVVHELALLPSPAARDYKSGESNLLERNARPLNEVAVAHLQPVAGIVDWGKYARAVLRWEHVLGRLVPCPLEPGRNGNLVLSPPLVEWMMGLDEGWVTGLDLSRSAKLRLLGNGVVPQQASLALSILLPRVLAAWQH
jgi:hypothetical protein